MSERRYSADEVARSSDRATQAREDRASHIQIQRGLTPASSRNRTGSGPASRAGRAAASRWTRWASPESGPRPDDGVGRTIELDGRSPRTGDQWGSSCEISPRGKLYEQGVKHGPRKLAGGLGRHRRAAAADEESRGARRAVSAGLSRWEWGLHLIDACSSGSERRLPNLLVFCHHPGVWAQTPPYAGLGQDSRREGRSRGWRS